MKKSIIAIITCLTFTIGFAQEFSTEMSSPFSKESDQTVYKIVFPSAYGFSTLRYVENDMMDNTKAMVVTKYDQSMTSVDSKTFNMPKLGLRAADLQDIIELEDKLIFLSTVMDKKSAVHQVNAQVYTEKDNTVSETQILASFAIEGYSRSGFYNMAVSPDKSKIAIIASMPFEKKTNEKVKVWVFDTQLNLLWEQEETLVYESDRAYNETIFVKNSGEVVMSKISDAFKKSRKTDLLTFNGSTVDTNDFSSPGFMPMEMNLIDVNGKSMLAGFFWKGKKAVVKINSKEGNDNDGAFLYDLEARNLIGIHEWDDTINSKDLKSLAVVDVLVKEDDIYLLGEKYLSDSKFRESGGETTMDIDYYYTYGSSVIVNMDTKGTLKSFTPLFNPKRYTNGQKEKGSFTAMFVENEFRVFANNKKHLTFSTFFSDSENEVKFNYPVMSQYLALPYILPKTVTAVKNYGIVYYITSFGNRYYFNRMTW